MVDLHALGLSGRPDGRALPIAGPTCVLRCVCAAPKTNAPASRRGAAVLLDMNRRPVEALPPEILVDVRRQMLERGDTSAARELEETYDFKTGRLRGAAVRP
jgi:hypothetical protein